MQNKRSFVRLKRRFVFAALFCAILVCFVFAVKAVWTQTIKYRLQPTDVISITVHGQPDLTTKTRITADGYITFPLLGKVAAKGLTLQEFELKLKTLLEEDYLVSAQVLAFIEDYHPRQVSVIGEVNIPGKYDMPEEKELTLIEAIALAGGFTKDAYLKKIKIMRSKGDIKETINIDVGEILIKDNKEKNIILEPDDIIIIVPESFF